MTNNAPPSSLLTSVRPSLLSKIALKMNLDFLTTTLAPVRHTAPPLEVELIILIPLLLNAVIFSITP